MLGAMGWVGGCLGGVGGWGSGRDCGRTWCGVVCGLPFLVMGIQVFRFVVLYIRFILFYFIISF